jgi:hypothetical protein
VAAVADSLLRILEKRRRAAMARGTFFVPVVGRDVGSLKPNDRLSVHDTILRPLLAKALKCRVYGIPSQSNLFKLVSRVGHRRSRIWRLDTSRELVHDYEPLWNSCCEHKGIVIVSRLELSDTQPILDQCGRPDAWGSRYQLYQGTSRAAIAFCFEAAQSSDVCVFALSGSNGMHWMDVFANEKRLPVLWDQAMRKVIGDSVVQGLTTC